MEFDDFKKLKEKHKNTQEKDIRDLFEYIDTLHHALARGVCVLEKIYLISGSATGFEAGNDAKNELKSAKDIQLGQFYG